MLFRIAGSAKAGDTALVPVALSTLKDADWTEKALEDVLARRIQDVLREDQLMVISQERAWKEEADILALDQEGVLFIFELKRVLADDSNLLQVIRYGQIFGQYGYDDLQTVFRRYRPDDRRELAEIHRQHFELEESLAKNKFNHDQRFIVVTAGVDMKTLDGIEYWKKKGLPIESITYHVYRHEDAFFLEFTSYAPDAADYSGLVSHDYIVNTNVTYLPEAYKEMLNGNKAAAYRERKSAVDGIQKGDRVFLYHTGVGIVAVGRAISSYQSCSFQGDAGEEHYIPLQMEMKVDPLAEPERCVSPSEINLALKANHRFRLTAFKVNKEMGDAIYALFKERQASFCP